MTTLVTALSILAGLDIFSLILFLLCVRYSSAPDPRTIEEQRIDEYFRRVYTADMSKEELDDLNAESWPD